MIYQAILSIYDFFQLLYVLALPSFIMELTLRLRPASSPGTPLSRKHIERFKHGYYFNTNASPQKAFIIHVEYFLWWIYALYFASGDMLEP